MADQTQPGGLFASLKALLATLIAIGHNRLELFSTELQEEIARAASVLLWGLAALLLAFLAILLGVGAVLIAVPEGSRAVVAALIALGVCAAAAVAALISHNRATAKPRLFDATLTELGKDRDQLSQ
jgi:uncharacterized membrane protein YqjE